MFSRPVRLHALALSALLASTALVPACLAATPEAKPANLSQSVETAIKDAQAKRLSGDFSGAVKVLSQLMLVNPDDARVVSEYGKTLVQQGRSREALDFLNRAVQLNSSDWTLYSALGVALDSAGDYASAKAAYERALQLKPGEPAVLNNYALSRAMAGDPANAKTLIAQAGVSGTNPKIAQNAKMIAALPAPALKTAAPVKPGAKAAAKQTPNDTATAAPRTLTTAEGRQVVMQAVPVDPQAGPAKPPKAKAAKTAKKSDGIPSLRLANDKP
jgi:Flp pilus assembly protein TadD, contains TPR repeats